MAVLVDELREYPHVRFAVKHWCHMVSDTGFDELHAFAAALGISRERFQRDHYDLPPPLRVRAIERGAQAVTIHELSRRMAGPRGERNRARHERRRAAGAAEASSLDSSA
jgi:hypothetical protein